MPVATEHEEYLIIPAYKRLKDPITRLAPTARRITDVVVRAEDNRHPRTVAYHLLGPRKQWRPWLKLQGEVQKVQIATAEALKAACTQ
eukprot:CAMPEP_0117620954 /NCGR_PEP_ID=MMETSP0784-20121206/87391_1 /TAXON_ID=39447 /ORGANISM="" /LENGTH=87 /DNA_ID=CAMNT_0005424877 /DNA_START=173 /DNA_END=436 /DNA_ORIENTATION=+